MKGEKERKGNEKILCVFISSDLYLYFINVFTYLFYREFTTITLIFVLCTVAVHFTLLCFESRSNTK